MLDTFAVVFCLGSDFGVIGKGMANSRGVLFDAMIRGFVGEEREGEGGHSRGAVGREGVAVLGDLGEREARRCVKADCFGAGWISRGSSARGMFGTFAALACSYTRKGQ